mgnify:FL=1
MNSSSSARGNAGQDGGTGSRGGTVISREMQALMEERNIKLPENLTRNAYQDQEQEPAQNTEKANAE